MIDNKTMEALIALAVLGQIGFQSFLIYKIYVKTDKPKPNRVVTPKAKTRKRTASVDTQDVYSPMWTENTVPLEEFIPKAGKIKIVHEDTKDQITPLNGQEN
jgi:hypothetical protein